MTIAMSACRPGGKRRLQANLTFEVLRYKLGLPVSAPYSLTDMASDGLGLMDALHIEQFHVLGASMGGMIAQHMAAMAPQRVESLTLIMTSSGAEGLPAPSAALVQLLSRRGAPNREVALEQQADLLAALGSPTVTDDRQACCFRRRSPMTGRSIPKA
jgi:pimeloyl-ACP methyl ester carboxylesterase